ncbi:MAG: sn-glycerol-3-phosphate ABC transporter ATP-binding protein UgpC [Rhodobacteraceae bacterium]|jgi:sn-glycerol 3-phosphate transport system ATP-binding protein|uniref:Carbohydrate ABC transporter ATP-binding protein, CUT1 family n=1 Tax=Salipiger profundus TaxID=1229727 RepID=A0A1U7D8I2_9RHOB|nr:MULTISPECIES: sn-glycerol-3-phosphate ABC transporter ATP-binding protein UgpC [Salipiger]APX24433.1 carbohydrate ABC transporter ATP-binding protein, CUT1 family [Salipiger profundus]MAB07266.1 sn-glycerol-3-phosphate ABC transporter ATP-binding protein UgpC [Paracoccaceae bacterium]GGA19934.1 sn-glycerol-3-phosphate import ATP-binding protein UgpC [Salipiger profundus]SFD38724.1 carbohydrate ABC transporter ATP-binding protein, CUT1 family [Salipiger profundus]
MARVTLDRVRKIYPNGFEAVKPCSFTIPDGEFLVLVGPSGCGKSTLLRMIAGLEHITEGTLGIGERVVNTLDPADRDIAMVFQNYALYPHMTVRKNIGYGLKNRRVSASDIAAKVEDAARMLNLTDYLDRKPSQLSGGQRQRVAMGRAIVRDPALFLFDEPLSNLDAKLRNQMRIEIKALQRRLGVTSIYVTHDQVEAMTMADRIVVLNGGRIEQIGTPSEIYHRPASTFVASFMGAPPMNLIRAQIDAEGLHLGDRTPLAAAPDHYRGAVTLGIRPEDVRIGRGSATFDVTLVEELGAHRLLHGQVAGQAFTAHVLKDTEVSTGALPIELPQAALTLFDHQTGVRL